MVNRRIVETISTEDCLLDRTQWPTVLIETISPKNQDIYLKRKRAVDLYFDGNIPVNKICDQTGIKRQQLERFIKNCIEFDNNGVIYGYRALIPYKRIKKYERRKEINGFDQGGDYLKLNGAFSKLLTQHPVLKDTIDNYILNRQKRDIREPVTRVKYLHRKFISLCKSIGLDPVKGDYPFNTEDLGRIALYRYVKKLEKEFSKEAISRYGKDAVTQYFNTGVGEQNSIITRPYQRVEFDGHLIDAVFAIEFETPEGDRIIDVLGRIWLLAVVDVATRTILGYHLCFNKEYSADDVLKCIRNAIMPRTPMEFTIPGLAYPTNGGFASELIPELEYAVWDEMAFDNAKANLAKKVTEKLKRTIGSSVNTGPVGTPTRRPIIEKFFDILEENGFHRMPNTTGSNPKDPRRKNPEQKAIDYQITVEELKQIVEVLIAIRNGTPQYGTNNLSPLEVLQQRVVSRKMEPRILEEEKREDINLLSLVLEVTVQGNIKTGRRPYVYYMGVEYRSELLSNSYHLVGRKLKIVVNTDDLRFFKAFLEDGSEIGLLKAKGKWGLRKHSLQLRKVINKLHRNKLIFFTSEDDPIEILFEYLRTKGKDNKNARNQLVTFETEITSNFYQPEPTYNQVEELKDEETSFEQEVVENKIIRKPSKFINHRDRKTFNS